MLVFKFPILPRLTGFSLLEVLITIVVLSVGLLGVAVMQLRGSEGTNNAYFRSQATIIGDELSERIHVNSSAADNNDYAAVNIGNPQDFCDTPPAEWCDNREGIAADTCDTFQMATFDIYSAACNIAGHLPTGALTITCDDIDNTDADVCTYGSPHNVTISWNEVDEGSTVASHVTIRVVP